ncbi:MAG: DUF2283 domain-containing protein, partial [Nitrospirota bacterium]
MNLKVDKDNDALYFRLNEAAIVESEEVECLGRGPGALWRKR